MIYKKYKYWKREKKMSIFQVTLCSATLLSILIIGVSSDADELSTNLISKYAFEEIGTNYNTSTKEEQVNFNKTGIDILPLNKINNATDEEFIKSVAPRTSQLATQNNLYASLIIAQAILESDYCQSNIVLNSHNLFNIVGAFNGQSITVSSGTYRAYETYDQSLIDYINLMKNGTTWDNELYISSWKTNSKSVEEAAYALQGIFSTDLFYAEKIIRIINEYNLKQYDDINNISTNIKVEDIPTSPLLNYLPDNLEFPEYNGRQYPGAESYAWGNCTQYVYNRIFQLGGEIGKYMGNGGDWGSNAIQQGYCTTNIPQVGYAVSFPPGVAGASSDYGHVAFVEDIHEDGSVLVSEMNVNGLNVVDYRTISSKDAGLSTYIQPK